MYCDALLKSTNDLKFIEKYTETEDKDDFFLQNLYLIEDRFLSCCTYYFFNINYNLFLYLTLKQIQSIISYLKLIFFINTLVYIYLNILTLVYFKFVIIKC